MANNWFWLLDGSTPSWVSSQIYGSVEQDLTCSYDTQNFVTDDLTPAWSPILDGTSNVWFQLLETISTLGTASADLSCSFTTKYGIYANSPTVTYQLLSSLGYISGQVMLPYGSVQQDYTGVYSFSAIPVTQDLANSYRILDSAENDLDEVSRVLVGVEKDLVPVYVLGGTVQQDLVCESDTWNAAERDLAGTYRVQNVIVEDSAQVTYSIVTNPLSAGDNRTFTYQVYSSISSDKTFTYKLLNSAERDVSDTWNIQLYAQRDFSPTWDSSGQTLSDRVVSYTIQGVIGIDADMFARYNVNAKTRPVPNVIGLPLPKAKKLLEDAGFVLGNITYN